MNETSFQNKVVIITGASSGIGREIALQLAEKEALLTIGARNEEKLNEVAQKCQQLGAKVLVVRTDVAVKEQCKNLIEKTVKQFGQIDMLVNNAGLGSSVKFGELPDLDLFEKVMQVNFFGGVYCTHFALPYLKTTKGRLVAVSSLAGKFPSARADGYGSSKHAMVGFYDSLRNELFDTGISITMIYPGWVCTGITSREMKMDGQPIGRISPHEEGAMSPETCARMIIHAAEKRQRQLVMTFQGKYGQWLQLIAPRMVDRITRKETR